MITLGEELREQNKKKDDAAAIKHRKEEEQRQAKLRRESKALAKSIIAKLEDDIRKANEAGKCTYDPFNLFINEFSEVQQRASWIIDEWAKANGMHTHYSHDNGTWDWPASDSYCICWDEHREARHW